MDEGATFRITDPTNPCPSHNQRVGSPELQPRHQSPVALARPLPTLDLGQRFAATRRFPTAMRQVLPSQFARCEHIRHPESVAAGAGTSQCLPSERPSRHGVPVLMPGSAVNADPGALESINSFAGQPGNPPYCGSPFDDRSAGLLNSQVCSRVRTTNLRPKFR